ncbi:MAG: dihydrofolate reductase family protein [Firmicutes bacterium]|nr:dihydrofolate reductase family protein [Bacillota bacterium]
MGYVMLQLAVSIDGYISRKDDSVDFLSEMEPNLTESFNLFLKGIETIIMGSRTYEVMLGFGEIPFQDKKIIVLTKRDLKSDSTNIIFTNQDIESLILHETGNIWLFGGSKVIQQCINKNLIDEYQIHVVPQIIGEGIPLFLESNEIKNLNLIRLEQFGNSYTVTYKKHEY